MSQSHLEFAESAQPHAWYLVADNLHAQALTIRSGAGSASLIRRDFKSGKENMWDWTDRTAFLLAGFALENLIKAYLVYENPLWIANGTLSRKLRSHRLVKLSGMTNSLPYRNRGTKTLLAFEEGLETWARYPCALTQNNNFPQKAMSERVWKGYQWLIESYGKRMVQMLQQEWNGPHGLSVRYQIEGPWLGAT